MLVDILHWLLLWKRGHVSAFPGLREPPSAREQLIILVATGARMSAFSLSNHPGTPSGPEALVAFSDDSF